MVPEYAEALPVGDEWVYEYSWRGERVFASKDGFCVRLLTLQHRDLTNRFPVVAAAVGKLRAHSAVIDGIVRAVQPIDLPKVSSGGNAMPEIRLAASDLLWLDGVDLRLLALPERRKRLQELLHETSILIWPTPSVAANELMTEARRLGADAVFAKRRDSRYRPFSRAGDWVRVALDASRQPSAVRGAEGKRDVGGGGQFGLGQLV